MLMREDHVGAAEGSEGVPVVEERRIEGVLDAAELARDSPALRPPRPYRVLRGFARAFGGGAPSYAFLALHGAAHFAAQVGRESLNIFGCRVAGRVKVQLLLPIPLLVLPLPDLLHEAIHYVRRRGDAAVGNDPLGHFTGVDCRIPSVDGNDNRLIIDFNGEVGLGRHGKAHGELLGYAISSRRSRSNGLVHRQVACSR